MSIQSEEKRKRFFTVAVLYNVARIPPFEEARDHAHGPGKLHGQSQRDGEKKKKRRHLILRLDDLRYD